jgi:hypothetical protein
MGAFFTNYHLRCTDPAAVAESAKDLIATRAYVSPAKDGWITLYDETSESQDTAEITRLGRELSLRLNTALFAFLIHDSDVFVYYLFDRGELIDEYNSDPAYFSGAVTEETRHRLAGQPPTVLKYCPAGTTLLEVESAMGWTQSSSPWRVRLQRLRRRPSAPLGCRLGHRRGAGHAGLQLLRGRTTGLGR